jgi:hypothetical protein
MRVTASGRSMMATLVGVGLAIGLAGGLAARRHVPGHVTPPSQRAGGSGVATLAWLVLVVGVLFFGLTSAQQRARLLQAVQTGRAHLGELSRDLQGYREDL